MEIIGRDGENFPTLPLDMEMDTALAIYCERRWPLGRRKAIEREWDLSSDEARSVVEGKASKRTISKIWKHKRGRWRVALPLLGAVIGCSIHDHFRNEIREAAREQERAEEHERLARAAWRRADPGPVRRRGSGLADGEAREDRQARKSA